MPPENAAAPLGVGVLVLNPREQRRAPGGVTRPDESKPPPYAASRVLQGAETFVTAVDVAREARCGRCCSELPESVAARGRGSGVSVVRGAGGNGFEQRTEGVHAYSKDEVGHFISRLTTLYSEAMDDVGLTDEQIVDVVNRVSDKLMIDMLTQDYGEIPAPTDN